jgi:hypothetical protein
MKKALVCLVGIALSFSCRGRQAQIDRIHENGVEVVLNHFEPYALKGQPSHLDLKEETRIDLEKEEYGGLGIKEPDFVEADSLGNIYVIEQYRASGFFVYEFSPQGQFIKKFGRMGQGPGELQGVNALIFSKTGHIPISDRTAGKVLEFDGDANFIRETRMHHAMREVTPLENGNYLARRNAKDSSDVRGMSLCLFGPDFSELKKLDVVDMSDMTPGKKNFGTIISFCWLAAGDRISVGNEQRGYEIWVFDLDGNPLRKIRKEYKPVPYPEDFRKQTETLAARQPDLNLVARPDTPPFNSFFADDEGRLFVMTYEHGQGPDEIVHDVFNKDGVLIARVPLPKYGILGRALNPLRATATNGRFYRLWFKEDGYPEVIVYRMLWSEKGSSTKGSGGY